ncbi:phage terminase small subunit [Hyphomicrobium sp. 1Nfss2.1]|uniref:terminase small subunit n=1 Tax=Hyphomicrobium sp. 1Nfss2.1 TaxID=3413936 RepID=UPI003C7C6D8F
MLDPVREAFVQEFHATGNASEALRKAKPHAAKWKPQVVHVKASEMLKEDEVQVRLQELQEEAAEKHGISIDTLTDMARKAFDLAMKESVQAPAAAVSAVMALGKLHGLIVDKKEVKRVRDVADISDDELAALARSGSPGVAKTESGKKKSNRVH